MKRLLSLVLLVIVLCTGFVASPVYAQDPCRDAQGNEICPHYNSFDDRVNYLDPIATMTAYCRDDGALDVWIINGYNGQYLYTAAAQTVSSGLGQAIATGQPVLVGDTATLQVWALPTNQLKLQDGRTGYTFTFNPSLCKIVPTAYTAPKVVTTPAASDTTSNETVPIATTVPVQPAVIPYDGTVRTTTRLIFRTLPDLTEGLVIETLALNTPLTVIARSADNQWLYITHKGKKGWVFAEFTNIPNSVKMKLPIGIPVTKK
ncbi:MAG: SH3 domain-containing protein [Anaerolineae bacterium]|nr:SH3 domain-containing protein [Anaerolineae bacterium]